MTLISSSETVDSSSVMILNMHIILPLRKPITTTLRKSGILFFRTTVSISVNDLDNFLNCVLEGSPSSSVYSLFGILTVTSKTMPFSVGGSSVRAKVVGLSVSTTVTPVIVRSPRLFPSASLIISSVTADVLRTKTVIWQLTLLAS